MKLSFEMMLLLCISILFIISMICSVIRPDSHVFDFCKVALPPIATLVIGYYFGKS
jgi:hypothetical protein